MNKIKKNVTVHFFDIEAKQSFFKELVTNFKLSREDGRESKIFVQRQKKNLVRLVGEHNFHSVKSYLMTIVRERATWQTKATSDGKISGVLTNQGVIGDPYFFMIVPGRKLLLGLSTAPSGNMKSVGKYILGLLQDRRTDNFKLSLTTRESERFHLDELPIKGNLTFKINSFSSSEISPAAPQLFKDLSSSPYIGGSQLSLDLEFTDASDQLLSKENIIEIVDYLSDHDECKMLKLKWIDTEGKAKQLDFINAFFRYKTVIETRQAFIPEDLATDILKDALGEYKENFS